MTASHNYGTVYDIRSVSGFVESTTNFWVTGSVVTGSNPYTYLDTDDGYTNPTVTKYPLLYVDDGLSAPECAVINFLSGDVYLQEFSIPSGTFSSSVTLLTTLNATPDANGNPIKSQWFALKRQSTTIYNIYYLEFTATNLRFGKVVVTKGVGSTNTVIDNIALDNTASTWTPKTKIIENTMNVVLTRKLSNKVEVYRYTFDMDTEVIGLLGKIWESSTDLNATAPTIFAHETLGHLKWVLFYYKGTTQISTYVVVDEIEYLQDTSAVGTSSYGIIGFVNNQYNSRDFVVSATIRETKLATPDKYTRVTVNSKDERYTYSNTPDAIFSQGNFCNLELRSSGVFPAIAYNTTSGSYYNVDPDTGIETSIFMPAGVDAIYYICPTLDSIDGSLYVIGDATGYLETLLLKINTTNNMLHSVLPVLPMVSYDGAMYNLGNFFINYTSASTKLNVTYLINNLLSGGINEVQMMIEQN